MLIKPASCKGCPLYEKPHGKTWGFSVPVGTGRSGVMIVAEALGEAEEKEGMALVGKSGYTLFQQLKRIDIERDNFTIFNTIACRPPDNKLVGMPYMQGAIAHCKPNLDAAVQQAKRIAGVEGKTFVIVTLGVTPFKAILKLDGIKDRELLKKDYYAYPFWSDTYGCWVLNAPHPAYLLRGNTHLWPVVQFVFKRALEIANNGLVLDNPDYLLDPDSNGFDLWIEGYRLSLGKDPDNPLSYDIETPYKKKVKDEEEIGKEEDADHTILRISFSYVDSAGVTHTVSVKWSAEYVAGIERLFDLANFVLGWNSDKYDYPRVSRHVKVRGIGLDGMVAWHILNSSLPKALGFVTPYYWQKTGVWKYLADSQPAYYNAKDADAALRNFIGIKRDLIANKLWHVYERHWIELAKALKFMSGTGVLRDNEMRDAAEKQLQATLDLVEASMEEAVPLEARELKIYKKKPVDKESPEKSPSEMGYIAVQKSYPAKYCEKCGVSTRLKWKKHAELCGGATTILPEEVTVWGKPLGFKVSKKRMSAYQKSLKHQAIIDRKENKVTYDADALTLLIKKYPKDPLYPRILEHRKTQKLLSTYVGITLPNGIMRGGMPVGQDGRIHTVYGRDASTLRFTSEDPNLQNLPRPNPKDAGDPANIIRNLIVAQAGNILYARDFSGIEAVLTGYFALDPRYIRLAKRDVHTYYTVYALYELEGGARIKAADLPDLGWSDERLFPYLEQLKKQFKQERNSLYKHLVHAANFMQGAKGAQAKIFSETGIEYPVKTVQKVMDVYYSLFPKIKQWHKTVLDEAERDGYLRNPFDYVHRYSRVYDYKKEFGEWTKKPGADANKVISFKPQSTAVGIITEAILRLYFNRFTEAGQFLRLQVHDELLFEIPKEQWETVDKIACEEMERAVPQLRLPQSWGMGDCLNILTEAKADLSEPSRWGNMRGL
jgi:uracil-DNA glycosylase family 4